jgi:hypothetical protein
VDYDGAVFVVLARALRAIFDGVDQTLCRPEAVVVRSVGKVESNVRAASNLRSKTILPRTSPNFVSDVRAGLTVSKVPGTGTKRSKNSDSSGAMFSLEMRVQTRLDRITQLVRSPRDFPKSAEGANLPRVLSKRSSFLTDKKIVSEGCCPRKSNKCSERLRSICLCVEYRGERKGYPGNVQV